MVTNYLKKYNQARKRNVSTNIRLTEEEHNELKRICKELEVTKVQFLLDRMKEYK